MQRLTCRTTETFFCDHAEIMWGLHTLAAQAGCVDEAYRRTWEASSPHHRSGLFLLSCLRPTDEPTFPAAEAEEFRRQERALRKQTRVDIRRAREGRIVLGKAVSKQQTAQRRQLRDEWQQRDEEERVALIAAGKAVYLADIRMCDKIGCEEVAMCRCSLCHDAYYCCRRREWCCDTLHISCAY